MRIIGYVALAVLGVQVYYIILHYDDISKYVSTYKNYRYGIDIAPQYIDPTTSDINDVIVADVRSKRRCALMNNQYVIVSTNGYAVDSSYNIQMYSSLMNCVIAMSENYSTMALSNPCAINQFTNACRSMLELL